MLALTLSQAKALGMGLVVVLVLGAIASAMIAKKLAQKVALVVILGLLALLFWTQRTALDECADKVRQVGTATGGELDTTCTFLGRDVQISTARA